MMRNMIRNGAPIHPSVNLETSQKSPCPHLAQKGWLDSRAGFTASVRKSGNLKPGFHSRVTHWHVRT